jgi:hypothetical protein
MSYIEVKYEVFGTLYSINKQLQILNRLPVLGFDVETRSMYTQEEIKEAKKLLKKPEEIHPDHLIHVKQVARSSGLSNPRIILTTHFIFGLSENEAIIFIAHDQRAEIVIWDWLVKYKGKLLIHNTGFDLKICYQRTGRLPADYEDTQLLAKSYINNAIDWKGKTGLKELMGGYYNPKWSLFEDYNIRNLRDKQFLDYCGIDGVSVVKLWNQLQEYTP